MKPKFNLEDQKRENVYNVPEAYFDKLPNRIMSRLTASPELEGSRAWLQAPWRLAFAGTGFAAIFATVFMLNVNTTEPSFTTQLAQVNEAEIVNYLLAYEQLERTDLALLKATDRDLTHEFLSLNTAEITEELAEEETIEDTFL